MWRSDLGEYTADLWKTFCPGGARGRKRENNIQSVISAYRNEGI